MIADRIVDLVIAAETLFLGDLDEKYRGELSFRFSLRAAKFVEHPSYSSREIFRLMRQAYNARSTVVHRGALPRNTRVPGDPSANMSTFVDAVEELVRLGIRKAVAMKGEGVKLRKSEYWEHLIL